MSTANIASVFAIRTEGITPVDRLVLVYIRHLIATESRAIPSYQSIANACGIVRRTAINSVKRLIKADLLSKELRFDPDKPAEKYPNPADRQWTNSYAPKSDESSLDSLDDVKVFVERPSEISIFDLVSSSNSPKDVTLNAKDINKRSNVTHTSFKHVIKTEEEYYVEPAPAREDSVQVFEKEIVKINAQPIRSAILDYIRAEGGNIRHYSANAIRIAFNRAAIRARSGVSFVNLPKWIAVSIRNVEAELTTQRIGRSLREMEAAEKERRIAAAFERARKFA